MNWKRIAMLGLVLFGVDEIADGLFDGDLGDGGAGADADIGADGDNGDVGNAFDSNVVGSDPSDSAAPLGDPIGAGTPPTNPAEAVGMSGPQQAQQALYKSF